MRRDKIGLHIRIAAGRVVVLRDNHRDCAAAIQHLYLGTIPPSRSHVAYAGHYEGDHDVLIDIAPGGTTNLQSLPVVSPTGLRFVTASADIVTGDNPNALQIWSMTRAGPELEWNARPG